MNSLLVIIRWSNWKVYDKNVVYKAPFLLSMKQAVSSTLIAIYILYLMIVVLLDKSKSVAAFANDNVI